MSDAATRSLDSLNDRSQWEVIPAVPVFDAHDEEVSPDAAQATPAWVVREGDRLVRRFDRQALQELADRANRRDRESGDLSPVGPGHTVPDQYDADGRLVRKVPEGEQPPVWGYARNWRVGEFGPSRKLGLLCDLYVRSDRADEVRRDYPRRSVELWLRDRMIDWIALLRRTPRRDLGLLTNSRRGACLRYAMEDFMPHDLDKDLPPGGPTDTLPDADALTPEEEKTAARYWKHYMKDPVMQFVKGCYEKGGMGGDLPPPPPPAPAPAPAAGDLPPPPAMPPAPPGEKEPERMQRLEAYMVQYDRYAKAMHGRLQAAERAARHATRKDVLVQYQNAGIQLDLARELQRYGDADEKTWRLHCEDIVASYGRDITAGPDVPVFSGNPLQAPAHPDVLTEEHQQRAQRYMRQTGCDWDEAVSRTKGVTA